MRSVTSLFWWQWVPSWLIVCLFFFFFMSSRECQLRSDCGSWSGLSGQHGPRRRSVRWSRKSVLLSAHLSERKITRTVAEMWQSFFICTCWATQHTLARCVFRMGKMNKKNFVLKGCSFGSFCDTVTCFPVGVPEADCVPEVHWQANRLFGSYAAVGREAGRPPTNDKLH